MEEKTLYLLIVGSRSISNYMQVGPALDALLEDYPFSKYVVVSGGSTGVDYLAELWAEKHGFEKKIFKADWDSYGKKAGYMRNEEMHKYIFQFEYRLVVAFWDGKSKGTAQNFSLADKYKNPIIIYTID